MVLASFRWKHTQEVLWTSKFFLRNHALFSSLVCKIRARLERAEIVYFWN